MRVVGLAMPAAQQPHTTCSAVVQSAVHYPFNPLLRLRQRILQPLQPALVGAGPMGCRRIRLILIRTADAAVRLVLLLCGKECHVVQGICFLEHKLRRHACVSVFVLRALTHAGTDADRRI